MERNTHATLHLIVSVQSLEAVMARPDISDERRAQILEAALTVFARQGFHQARMDDIAQESGLSKGALYLYYKSKDAMIGALMRSVGNFMLRSARSIETAEGSASERILGVTQRFSDEIERFSPALPVMQEFYAVAAHDKSVRAYLAEMYGDYANLLARVIEQGVEAGEFRAGDSSALALTLIAIWEGLALLWVMAPDRLNFRQQATLSVSTLLDGMRTRGA
jgi:AcrR family transcriptional regulator